MKALIIAVLAVSAFVTRAQAADMPMKAAPAPVIVPTYNWSGFYVGGHLGYGWVDEVRTVVVDTTGGFPAGFRFCCDRDGILGGGQVGFNWQTGHWVFGIEGDWSWTNNSVTKHPVSPTVPGISMDAFANDNWYATATGRVGFAQNNWLFYVKGGAAWLNSDRGATVNIPGVPVATVQTRSDTFTGWTVGGGVEVGFAQNWSIKLEYNYLDFGSNNLGFVIVSPPALAGQSGGTQGFDTYAHLLKVGINYRFDWAKTPVVVAKY